MNTHAAKIAEAPAVFVFMALSRFENDDLSISKPPAYSLSVM
jgi:hypothetical protein